MYLERLGRGSWSLTEPMVREEKGWVQRPCCRTGSWGLEGGGCKEGCVEQRRNCTSLLWHSGECGASARVKQSFTSALLSQLYQDK